MGNGTSNYTPDAIHDRLDTILSVYRGVLRADERRLLDAMREYERSCWEERMVQAA